MWEQHVLDNRNYSQDCELLVGHVVYYDPDGKKESTMAADVQEVEREGLTLESWWTVHVGTQLRVGATPLVERCMRMHDWSEDFALRVLEGYRIFLYMKHTFGDLDDKKLLPSIPVAQMWHQHILDNRNYSQDCKLLFGRIMYHDPDGGVDQEARDRRIERTMEVVGRQFDEEVWDFGVRAEGPEEATHANRELETAELPRLTNDGDEAFLRDELSTRMGTYFDVYAARKGVQRESLKFYHGGKEVPASETPVSLGLYDHDVIEVLVMVAAHASSESETGISARATSTSGAVSDSSNVMIVSVRDQTGEEIHFRVKRTTLMQKVFEVYTRRKGVRIQRTRFLFNGERVVATDTPLSLGMEDGDTIDFMSDQEGC